MRSTCGVSCTKWLVQRQHFVSAPSRKVSPSSKTHPYKAKTWYHNSWSLCEIWPIVPMPIELFDNLNSCGRLSTANPAYIVLRMWKLKWWHLGRREIEWCSLVLTKPKLMALALWEWSLADRRAGGQARKPPCHVLGCKLHALSSSQVYIFQYICQLRGKNSEEEDLCTIFSESELSLLQHELS